jgi:hypothetical protein
MSVAVAGARVLLNSSVPAQCIKVCLGVAVVLAAIASWRAYISSAAAATVLFFLLYPEPLAMDFHFFLVKTQARRQLIIRADWSIAIYTEFVNNAPLTLQPTLE